RRACVFPVQEVVSFLFCVCASLFLWSHILRFLSRRPPGSSLFPYTTLFRSMFMLYLACMSAITPPIAVACFAAATIAGANPMGIDRKSTRLNSSHVKISYAVFCLKKKSHHITRLLSKRYSVFWNFHCQGYST